MAKSGMWRVSAHALERTVVPVHGEFVLTPQRESDRAATWEKAVRKLRGRLMPPPGSKQPEQKEVDSLIGYLEA